MQILKTNTVVIGSGPGGYPAAIRLAQLGIDNILVEKKEIGGTCLNTGCIPSKALIHTSSNYFKIKNGIIPGINGAQTSINWEDTIKWKDKTVVKLRKGVQSLIKKNNLNFIQGEARIITPNLVEITGDESKKIKCENIVLATGSKIRELESIPFDHKQIIDSNDLLSLTEIPKSIIIIGGGVIGIELGTVYLNIGSQVTIVELEEQILPEFEKEAVQIVQNEFKQKGGKIITRTSAQSVIKYKDGVQLFIKQEEKEQTLKAEFLAVTTGRKIDLETAGIKDLKLKLNGNRIDVNHIVQTSINNIYAVGDITPGPMLAHKATAEAILAAEAIAGKIAENHIPAFIPTVVYSQPEIAAVGFSKEEARKAGYSVTEIKLLLATLGKSSTTNERKGYIKYIIDNEGDIILGTVIVGANASELISEAALAIKTGITIRDIYETSHPHPTFSEAHMELAKLYLKKESKL